MQETKERTRLLLGSKAPLGPAGAREGAEAGTRSPHAQGSPLPRRLESPVSPARHIGGLSAASSGHSLALSEGGLEQPTRTQTRLDSLLALMESSVGTPLKESPGSPAMVSRTDYEKVRTRYFAPC